MDTQLLITTIVALITTLTGALAGPLLLDWRKQSRDRLLRREVTRERPYLDFAAAVEQIQLDLDLMAEGYDVDRTEYLRHFTSMEEARSNIDLIGTLSARVWAYRCRLAISGMNRSLQSSLGTRTHYRAKLHDARSAFITQARSELRLTEDLAPPPIDPNEDTATGHERWLELDATPNAAEAVRVAYAELEAWLVAPPPEGDGVPAVGNSNSVT
ncbi:MAG: hypothetical protein M9947_16845 [Thermomicrobiales bacterium]|nr:hypothetical protein [Thermomicrobiales bacterium]